MAVARRSGAISKADPTRLSPSRARITAGYPAAARPTRRSRMRLASARGMCRANAASPMSMTSRPRSDAMPNLPDIIEIGYSRKRLLVLLAGGVALTAGSAAMAFHLLPDTQVGAFYTAVGYFGVLFFGFAILKMGWLLVTARGPVLFIDR